MSAGRTRSYAESFEDLINNEFTIFTDLTGPGMEYAEEYIQAKKFAEHKINLTENRQLTNEWVGKVDGENLPTFDYFYRTEFGIAVRTTGHSGKEDAGELEKRQPIYEKLMSMLRFPNKEEYLPSVEYAITDCNRSAYLSWNSLINQKFQFR